MFDMRSRFAWVYCGNYDDIALLCAANKYAITMRHIALQDHNVGEPFKRTQL